MSFLLLFAHTDMTTASDDNKRQRGGGRLPGVLIGQVLF